MSLNELSAEFNLLYDNISSNQAPGLTEYEKSVFLTEAQEAVILDLYKGTAGDAFENTEEVTRYLSSLVKSKDHTIDRSKPKAFLNTNEYTIDLSDITDLWFITFQSASIINGASNRDVLVVPTTQDSLYKELRNPFKGPNKNKVLSISEEGKQKIFSNHLLNNYHIKYLSKPYPIILEDSDISINGQTKSKEIDWLPESLQRTILLRAVQIAKSVWNS